LKPGYAEFCKHLFIPNFTPAKVCALKITPENEGLLKSGYEARREEELAVLSRWYNASDLPEVPVAQYLDVILYSKEQIDKENAAMGAEPIQEDYDYGIISIKPQDADFELPMQPITMMRNALGAEHGGSGVPLDQTKYRASVDYWSKHAIIR
jgi:hypothetical protein